MLGGTVFVLTQRNVATHVSLDDAVGRFRAGAPTLDAENQVLPAPEAAADQPAPTGRPVAERATEEDVAEAAPEAAVSPATREPYVLPDEGVYAYRTQGSETVSTFGAKHTYPERSFATVRHMGGCRWEHRHEVLEEHVDIRHFCGAQGTFQQIFYERQVTFFGQTDGGAMRCEPAIALHRTGIAPGDEQVVECEDGEGGHATMTRTFLGIDATDVGGEVVKAVKVTVEAEMTGTVDGESSDTLWYHPLTGMTLRWDRTVDTLATAYGTKIHYTEDASFVLESLEAQR
jgi:hypothetical protein